MDPDRPFLVAGRARRKVPYLRRRQNDLVVRTQILFSPENVKSVLATLPSVAALIADPADEGKPSDAFPGVLRKTERELYRWIANTHYEHLAEVVPTLERVHAAGCVFGNFLTTRSREQFVSYTAELFVADDLLQRGYSVRTIPLTSEATPDLHVNGEGVDLAVEVYSPRELVAVDEWVREVNDLLSYVDIRANYRSSVATKDDPAIPPGPLPLDPWATAEALDKTREDVFAKIIQDVKGALHDLRPLDEVYAHEGTPLLTTVELEDVAAASPSGPIRNGSFSYPGLSGYSPAGVFRTVVERALRKARKRQTEGVTARARALVVYLMGTKIAEDLVVPAHFREAEKVVEEIEPHDHGIDAIAFVVRALPRGLAAIFTVLDDSALTEAQGEALFGRSD
jgi:hypothetical protein